MPDPFDRLHYVLRRALHRAKIQEEAQKLLSRKSKDGEVAEDYVKRLAEKYIYRQLLSDDRMDAMRFRWYFTHVKKDISLEELRLWIDHKLIEEDHAHKN